MKTLKEIRDVLKNNYKNHSCQQRQNEDVDECWQALDTIIASIPVALGEAINYYEIINEPDPTRGDSSALQYKVYEAAKLLHRIKGLDNQDDFDEELDPDKANRAEPITCEGCQ